MSRLWSHAWWSDARHYQIAALATLLIFNLARLDFGARPLNSALAIAGALAMQALCTRWYSLPSFDPRSPLITGLSLSLLLRAEEPWLHALAAVIAVGSKFVFRIGGKHIWNPAGFAIVVLLLGGSGVWISPGQWGSTVWFAALLCFFAILVLHAARRSDIAVFFLASHAALLLARACWLGDPLAIPIHQLESGSLLIFAFFMISDPRTSPDSRLGRFIFAVSVALAGHYLTFFMQMRPALYVALIALSPLILLIDKVLPAERFQWGRQAVRRQNLQHQDLQHQDLQHQDLQHQDLQHQDLQHQDLQHQDLQHQALQHQAMPAAASIKGAPP